MQGSHVYTIVSFAVFQMETSLDKLDDTRRFTWLLLCEDKSRQTATLVKKIFPAADLNFKSMRPKWRPFLL